MYNATRQLDDWRRIPCPLIEDLLPLYVEGEVNSATQSLVADHLAQCAHCAGFLAGARSVRSQLRPEAQPAPVQRPRSSGALSMQFILFLSIVSTLLIVVWGMMYAYDAFGETRIIAILIMTAGAILALTVANLRQPLSSSRATALVLSVIWFVLACGMLQGNKQALNAQIGLLLAGLALLSLVSLMWRPEEPAQQWRWYRKHNLDLLLYLVGAMVLAAIFWSGTRSIWHLPAAPLILITGVGVWLMLYKRGSHNP